jgi:hypothetical protein
VVCILSHCISIFYILTVTNFYSIGYSVFIPFLCTQERQCAPSPPISPIHGDGDAATTQNSGGDVLVSGAYQQAHDMGTQVLSHASSIFSSNCGRH